MSEDNNQYDNLTVANLISSVDLPVVGYQWLHHDPATGSEFWLNSKFLSGRKSSTFRPLYLDPKSAILAKLLEVKIETETAE